MIKYVKGNLFDAPESVIAHGCNCSGGFGSGVAKQMIEYHPETKAAYLKRFHEVGWTLGELQLVHSNGKIIVNCATQQRYGPPGEVYVSYKAIKLVMERLYKFLQKDPNLTIAIPKIGAGLAGGDWRKIETIINYIFKDREIVVYYL